MDEALRIQQFNSIPSPEVFTSQIESRNAPAVFHGCIKDWEAISKWNPSNTGLDYFQEQVGSSVVEAMLSRSAPVFYGDLRSHERVQLPFSTFIISCKQLLQNADDGSVVCVESEDHGLTGSNREQDTYQLYLAQVPILNMENQERSQLEILKEDIQMPTFLETKAVASINIWMNNSKSRSSTHYDPHHNLLCVVAGCKKVFLWPPSVSPSMYLMPIFGEASNHSSVSLENPDFSVHPRAKHLMEYSQTAILCPGDALFIPEGWFHQVDSNDLTIAVNFWWQSTTMSSMSEHMDAYYFRRVLRRLIDKEMNQMLHTSSVGKGNPERHANELHENKNAGHHMDEHSGSKDLKGKNQKQIMLDQLEPPTLQALHELVSLVHENVNVASQSGPEESTSDNNATVNVKGEDKKLVTANLFHLDDDPVAKILRNLEPLVLQNILQALVHNFPRTLEALILHMLSPVGSEVLTQKFDEMDQQTIKEERDEFYQAFYSIFDDQFAVMDSILNGKEQFARQALRNVLDLYVGAKYDGSNRSAE
ncbi:uncharacterized protein LOC122648635 isoform X2 [Telopea speciosissima]|uniref:uncharacterized protein LOC122648635 isoform X2 n=1 Tax=Telopea speciosissima TaxID=54955 RepID=UPI001CC4E94D|nr:uncharacterized protein LOC122648635 isoform X2 [Telopea speciosissima]